MTLSIKQPAGKALVISRLLIMITAVLAFILIMGSAGAQAADKLKFKKSKVNLYEGNIYKLNLVYGDTEYFQDTDEFDWWSYFNSSDENVARVDYMGNVVCVGTGTSVITVYHNDMVATCTVNVKANKLTLSEDEITLYSDQSCEVKMGGVKGLKNYSYDYRILDSIDDYSYTDAPSVVIGDKGKFIIAAGKKGDYEIRLVGIKKNGTQYSKKLILHTIEAGPDRRDISVAVGYMNNLKMVNSEIVSVDLVRWYDGTLTYYPEDEDMVCPIKSNGLGEFTADEDAQNVTATFQVNYQTEDGTELSTTITVSTYDPDYEPFSDYLWVGQSYAPKIINERYSTLVVCTSLDPDVLTIGEDGRLIPLKGGSARIKIWVDGKEFTDTVNVVDINVNGNNILTWPGTNFSFNVTGAPDDMKITYSSSNPDIANISKKGKLKVKKFGFTLVTVNVGGYEYYYTVNVATELAVKAALAASEVVGKATYSQDRRMEEGYYDCSSLVWRSYEKAGLKIKNESYAPTAADLAQYLDENGYTISYSELPAEELLPGDLLFSTTPGSSNGRFKNIDHAAMYYSTNGVYHDIDGYDGYAGTYDMGYGTIVHAGSRGGGVYFSEYPSYLNIVLIARIKQ